MMFESGPILSTAWNCSRMSRNVQLPCVSRFIISGAYGAKVRTHETSARTGHHRRPLGVGRLLLQVHVRGAHLLHQACGRVGDVSWTCHGRLRAALLDQTRDVALAEHARHKRLDLEVLEVLDVLARADVPTSAASTGEGRGVWTRPRGDIITHVIGAPVAATAESAPPPLAWPSSLVMMTEPTATFFLKALACSCAACPMDESMTNMT